MKNIFIVLFIFISINSFGQSIVTDRPDQTESSVTVPKGSLQIESGLIFSYSEDDIVLSREIAAPLTLFRIGITKGIELRVFNQYQKIKRNDFVTSGISDLEIGAKIQLLKKEKINIAFISHLVTPTGTIDLSGDRYGTINKLAVSHSIKDNIGVGYNIGYSFFGEGNGNLLYSMAVAFSVNDKTSFYVEPYGEIINFEDLVSNIDAGITYLITDNLQADFSFGTGTNNRMNYMAFGISWRILKKKTE